jgi:hypothetical protein
LDVLVLRESAGTGGLGGILKLLSVAGFGRLTRLDLEGVFRIVVGCEDAGIGRDDFGMGNREILGIPVGRTGGLGKSGSILSLWISQYMHMYHGFKFIIGKLRVAIGVRVEEDG